MLPAQYITMLDFIPSGRERVHVVDLVQTCPLSWERCCQRPILLWQREQLRFLAADPSYFNDDPSLMRVASTPGPHADTRPRLGAAKTSSHRLFSPERIVESLDGCKVLRRSVIKGNLALSYRLSGETVSAMHRMTSG